MRSRKDSFQRGAGGHAETLRKKNSTNSFMETECVPERARGKRKGAGQGFGDVIADKPVHFVKNIYTSAELQPPPPDEPLGCFKRTLTVG